MLEGETVTETTRRHLDRCLGCQACETTCPSGVDYTRLLDIGRVELQQRLPRPALQSAVRRLMRAVLSRRTLVIPLTSLGRLFRPLLPQQLRQHLPPARAVISNSGRTHARRVVLAQGCVQPALTPTTNQAASRVLDVLGVSTLSVAAETCCGALAYHSDGQAAGLDQARRNIDAWWSALESGAEAIVMTASGCSNFVREYDRLLDNDSAYAEKARRVKERTMDIGEFLVDEDLSRLEVGSAKRIAWHCPCTAQHGQKLDGAVREVLTRLGFAIPPVRDAHLCCGSAGSYSLFHPAMAAELRSRKLVALQASAPEQIVTANVGCQVHLAAGTETPVAHWIELVARSLRSTME